MPDGAHPVATDDNCLIVVLARPEQPRNVGAVLRACANFRVAELVTVAPSFDWDDPENRRLITIASAGGQTFVPVIRCVPTLAQALASARYVVGATARTRHNRNTMALTEFVAKLATNTDWKNIPLALVFGCESQGLNAAEIDECHEIIHIESTLQFPSLNIGHAVAVTLHTVRAALQPAELHSGEKLSTVEDWERLIEMIGEDGLPMPQSKNQLRSLLARACPTADEMSMLYSLVRRRLS